MLRYFDSLRHTARLKRWPAAHAWGRRGEDLAHRYLRRRGYVVIARNWRTRSGQAEIDLIARKGEALVFVEVKTRETAEYGAPDEAVDREKRRHILRAAAEYLKRADLTWDHARFDVISVLSGPPASIAHIEDAFSRT